MLLFVFDILLGRLPLACCCSLVIVCQISWRDDIEVHIVVFQFDQKWAACGAFAYALDVDVVASYLA